MFDSCFVYRGIFSQLSNAYSVSSYRQHAIVPSWSMYAISARRHFLRAAKVDNPASTESLIHQRQFLSSHCFIVRLKKRRFVFLSVFASTILLDLCRSTSSRRSNKFRATVSRDACDAQSAITKIPLLARRSQSPQSTPWKIAQISAL